MEASIERIFTPDMVELAGRFFQVDAGKPVKLGDAENYVFEVYRDGTPYILRLTHQSHRAKDQVLAELKWMEYLQDKGCAVPRVLHSRNQNLVEVVKGLDGSEFHCCLFEKAPGARVKLSDGNHKGDLFYVWGKTIGQQHQITKDYIPGHYRRMDWHEEELLDAAYYQADAPEQVLRQQEAIIRKLKDLPVHRDNFGLIHSDIHQGNFHYHEGKIYVFDFDDCSNHWFASDLAIPLYYLIWSLEREGVANLNGYAATFMKEFIRGYEAENELSREDYEAIPLFLKVRDLTLYNFFYKKYDWKKEDRQWNEAVRTIEKRIIENRPIVHIDLDVALR
ncbi:phosphotransferase [Peribacillus sp. SI8-4]|uniref:phosphotransferase enzyme family protein n=1 Tax=Peribacillus sp. SI8-4 TaxID=3048009 RepID=UPI00255619C7|nr:phosphotransferase [Peribacillus sp. SI8-4]